MPDAKVQCQICDHRAYQLVDHILEDHGLSVDEYVSAHPGAEFVSEKVLKKVGNVRRGLPAPPSAMRVNFAGTEFGINFDVPASDCLEFPNHYRIPQHGQLAEDVKLIAISLQEKRSMYLHGPTGVGKDAAICAWSAMTRTPGDEFQVVPGVDLQPWLWSRSFSRDGTHWEEGRLLKLARDGYLTTSGRRIPAVILLTDFDRAESNQAEFFRLLLGKIQNGRIPKPEGGTWPMFPGTQIIATANTAGMGDETGRYVSTNIIDVSILGRFERAYKMALMDWEDEEPILREKFPLFAEKMGNELRKGDGKGSGGLGAAVGVLRMKIEEGSLYAEFSHRDVCNWVSAAEDILRAHQGSDPPSDLMRKAGRAVFDKFPDEETRLQALRAVHPHIGGGMVTGTTEKASGRTLEGGVARV